MPRVRFGVVAKWTFQYLSIEMEVVRSGTHLIVMWRIVEPHY